MSIERILLTAIVAASLTFLGCSDRPATPDEPATGSGPAQPSAADADESRDEEVSEEAARAEDPSEDHDGDLGRLLVRATDGGVHRVRVEDASGETIATGSSSVAFDVPPGEHTAHVQGHSLPVTIAHDELTEVRVVDHVQLGRLMVRATDGGVHRVRVEDASEETIATGSSSVAFDVPPGEHTAHVQGHSLPVTIAHDELTEVRVVDHVQLGRLMVRATDGGVHRVRVEDASEETIATGSSSVAFDVPPGRHTVHVQGHSFPVTIAHEELTEERVFDHVQLGRLMVRATDGGVHRVRVEDASGETIATGSSSIALDVPPGEHTVHVQEYSFPVTITHEELTQERVFDHVQIGRLLVRATDGGLHRVRVEDGGGETIATGNSSIAFDVPPGEHTVHVQGHSFPVTITHAEVTRISVTEAAGLE